MINVGAVLELAGKTQKGKNRVREFGSRWVVFRIEPKVLYSQKAGPWLLVDPGCEKGLRWIHGVLDDDFEVVSCKNRKPLPVAA